MKFIPSPISFPFVPYILAFFIFRFTFFFCSLGFKWCISTQAMAYNVCNSTNTYRAKDIGKRNVQRTSTEKRESARAPAHWRYTRRNNNKNALRAFCVDWQRNERRDENTVHSQCICWECVIQWDSLYHYVTMLSVKLHIIQHPLSHFAPIAIPRIRRETRKKRS